jgi:hypothetical protein
MNTFNYNGIEVAVYNDGGKVAVDYIHTNTPNPTKFVSGDRIEFQIGSIKYIYSVNGIMLNQITTTNEVAVNCLLVNILPSGKNTVILSKTANYSVSPTVFYGMSQLQNLPESTILGTMFMHFLNGLLSRIPELGGTPQGWGLEYFNNDGTVSEPLYTFTQKSTNKIEILPVVESQHWKLLVNGQEWIVEETVETTTETLNEETGEMVTTTETTTTQHQSLIITDLTNPVYQIEYQILNEDGTLNKAQTRNIFLV